MKVELKLYASLAQYLPEGASERMALVDAGEGTTVRELLSQMKVPPNAIKIMFLNGVHAKGKEVLKDGDRLGVFPPVAGG